MPTLEHCTISF